MGIRQKLLYYNLQEMLECRDKLRCDPPDNYTHHDRLFANRINHLIKLTDASYQGTIYRDALKTGFYDLQVRTRKANICGTTLLHETKVSCNFKEYHRSNATIVMDPRVLHTHLLSHTSMCAVWLYHVGVNDYAGH